MTGEWPRVSIESLIQSGAIIGHKDGNYGSLYPSVEEFGVSGVPFLTAKSLSDGKIEIEHAPRLATERADKLRFGFVKPDDVLLSHNATIGRVAVVPKFTGRLLIGTSLTYFRVDQSRIFPRYLAAYFVGTDFQNQLAAVMSHTTRNQVPITAQRRLHIVLPPLRVQQAIAGILASLDDKIELNRRTNETLEAMARTLFRSWFVDFDPVRAKVDGQKPHGMDAATAKLFPDSFEPSTLGPIPKGWKVGNLGEVASNPRRGVAPNDVQPGTPYIGLEHMPRRSICLGEWGCPEELVSGKFRFDRGNILFGKLRPYFHKVGVAPVDGICSTDILIVTPKQPEWFGYVLGHVSSDELVAHTDAASTGTKMPRTNWSDIARYAVAVPPIQVADLLTKQIDPLVQLIRENILQSRTLAATRDALLPKLLSGELSVSADGPLAEVRLCRTW